MIDTLLPILRVLLWCVNGLLVLVLAYHYLFVVASAWPRKPSGRAGTTQRTFALVIPAHNEQAVIARTIEYARRLDYPSAAYDV